MAEGIGNHILTICEILGIVNRSNLMYRYLLNGFGGIIINEGSWLMVQFLPCCRKFRDHQVPADS